MNTSEKNVFLNTLGQMNREMYRPVSMEHGTSSKKSPRDSFGGETHPEAPRQAKESSDRFEADMMLHRGVKAKTQKSDESRLIANLTEEIKNLKQKMSFVIEKDEEIYRLKCENTLLEKKYAELQGETVTDESLVRDKEELQAEIVAVRESLQTLSVENIGLKKKLVELYRRQTEESGRTMSLDSPEGYILNIGTIKQKLASQNIQRVDSVLLAALLKYQLSDKQWVTSTMMERLMKEIILGCKLTLEDV